MAKLEAGLYRGTIGDKIYSIDPKTHKQIVRHNKKKVKNPKTQAQQSRRSNFGQISTLSSKMTEAHKIGLHLYAQRNKLYTYTAFRSLNSQCFTPEGEINFPRITLSSGNIAPVIFTSVTLDGPITDKPTSTPTTNSKPTSTDKPTSTPTHDQPASEIDSPTNAGTRLLHLTYDPNQLLSNASPNDQLFIFVYCHTLQIGHLHGPYPRLAETITIPLPAEWPTAHTHLYAFLRGNRLRTPNTIYIPLS